MSTETIRKAPPLRLSGSAEEIADVDRLSFDYAALDTETRIVVAQRTTEIRDRMRRAAQDIVEIGERLIEVKARLPHGQFGAWLQAEFEWSYDTALNFMRVARAFGQNPKISEIAPSALYLLATPSTPDKAREEALSRAEAGERIGHAEARAIVQAHKPAPAHDAQAFAALVARFAAAGATLAPADGPPYTISRGGAGSTSVADWPALERHLASAEAAAQPTRPDFTEAEIADAVRACLVRLQAHAAQPLLTGLTGDARLRWSADAVLVRSYANQIAAGDLADARTTFEAVEDPALRLALRTHHAEQVAGLTQPAPADTDLTPLRMAILAGPHRWDEARRLIAALPPDIAEPWAAALTSALAADRLMRQRYAAGAWEALHAIQDDELRARMLELYAGAARELAVAWPPDAPAAIDERAEPTPENALAAIAARVEAVDLAAPDAAEQLDQARRQAQYLVTNGRVEAAATGPVVTRILVRGLALAAPVAAASGAGLRIASYDPTTDRWELSGPAGPEAYRGGQLRQLLGRLEQLARHASAAPPAPAPEPVDDDESPPEVDRAVEEALAAVLELDALTAREAALLCILLDVEAGDDPHEALWEELTGRVAGREDRLAAWVRGGRAG